MVGVNQQTLLLLMGGINMIKNPKNWRAGYCPNRKLTHSFNVYIRTWRSLIRKVERLTNLKCIGFDPGLLMADIKDKKYGSTISLPVWFAMRILRKIERVD